MSTILTIEDQQFLNREFYYYADSKFAHLFEHAKVLAVSIMLACPPSPERFKIIRELRHQLFNAIDAAGGDHRNASITMTSSAPFEYIPLDVVITQDAVTVSQPQHNCK